MNVLDAVGNTSLVELRRIVPPLSARVFVKLEGENPTGSMKDRMARAVVAKAEADGRLKKGGTVVEYTGGSTGTSLAFVCAAKGYRVRIVTSDAFSKEKRDHMAAFGAEVTLVPSEGGLATKQLFLDMIEAVRSMSREDGVWWNDQLRNADSIAGYASLGEEIWSQTNGTVDAFVQSVGTSASLRGVAAVLRPRKPGVRIVAVEPAESAVLSGGPPGAHGIEGIGIGAPPPLWEPGIVDGIEAVSTRGSESNGATPRAGRGALRGNVLGRERRRGAARRAAARAGRDGRHAHDRLRPQVREHGRVPERVNPLLHRDPRRSALRHREGYGRRSPGTRESRRPAGSG